MVVLRVFGEMGMLMFKVVFEFCCKVFMVIVVGSVLSIIVVVFCVDKM